MPGSLALSKVPNEVNLYTMNHDLAAEIHRRAEQDQAARCVAANTRDGREMCRIDAENTAWLKQVIAEHGWPGVALLSLLAWCRS